MLSYWEMESYFRDIDVTIIGSGIIGLSAALNLKLLAPKLKILILERGYLPTGASTKNAGFACFGSPSELLDDIKQANENEVFALVEKRWLGLQKLRHHLGDQNIDFLQLGGYELFSDEDHYEQCLDALPYLNSQLNSFIKHPQVFKVADDKINEFAFKNITHLLFNALEGQIDTGKMMLALTKRVQELGVIILNSIEVKAFFSEKNHVFIKTNKELEFKSNRLLIAVNGFARELLPDYPVYPARSQVVVTKPINDLKVKGTFHYDEGFYYFRNIGNRLLLGGGRNLDFETEATAEFGLTEKIQNRLEHLLATMILPNCSYEIDQRWSGIMGLGIKDKRFIVKEVAANIYCSIRMGGMGIAVGSLVGEEVAKLMLSS